MQTSSVEQPCKPWEKLEASRRCAVLSQVSKWISSPDSFPRGNELQKFLDNFEVNNGLLARQWLIYKYEESVLQATELIPWDFRELGIK